MSVLPILNAPEATLTTVKVKASPDRNWLTEACVVVHDQMPRMFRFSSEDLRTFLLNRDVDPPKHDNSWGALVNHLVQGELIIETGEFVKAKRPAARSRRLPVYIRI